MEHIRKNVGYILAYTACFVIISLIIDLAFGNNTEEFDWIKKTINGLVASVIVLLLNYYEKKNIK